MNDTAVSLAEAKARFNELTELAAAGEEVVITKRGKPVVRLSHPAALTAQAGGPGGPSRLDRTHARAAGGEQRVHAPRARREPLLVVYVDTSFLVAALTREPRTPEIQEWLAAPPAGQLAVSDWGGKKGSDPESHKHILHPSGRGASFAPNDYRWERVLLHAHDVESG
jgi:antitoxin (DNA-binding transcriptional repressor) of toxin-antitoxin stability system